MALRSWVDGVPFAGYVMGMSDVLQALVRRIRAIPSAQWESLAREAGCAVTLPRKLAYGDRANPRIQTIQPLLTHFARLDSGEEAVLLQKPPVSAGTARPIAQRDSQDGRDAA